MLLITIVLVVLLPLVVVSLLAWRFGVDSRHWGRAGDWAWFHRTATDGADPNV